MSGRQVSFEARSSVTRDFGEGFARVAGAGGRAANDIVHLAPTALPTIGDVTADYGSARR